MDLIVIYFLTTSIWKYFHDYPTKGVFNFSPQLLRLLKPGLEFWLFCKRTNDLFFYKTIIYFVLYNPIIYVTEGLGFNRGCLGVSQLRPDS